MKYVYKILGGIAGLLFAVYLAVQVAPYVGIDFGGLLDAPASESAAEQEKFGAPLTVDGDYWAEVTRVVDGDTFIIKDGPNAEIRVRLIGVNTEESVAPQEYLDKTGKENTEAGKLASDYTKALLTGKTIVIRPGEDPEDPYGRLLAYVFIELAPDSEFYPEENDPGETNGEAQWFMVQTLLLNEGLAEPMTIEPNTAYADYFESIYDKWSD